MDFHPPTNTNTNTVIKVKISYLGLELKGQGLVSIDNVLQRGQLVFVRGYEGQFIKLIFLLFHGVYAKTRAWATRGGTKTKTKTVQRLWNFLVQLPHDHNKNLGKFQGHPSSLSMAMSVKNLGERQVEWASVFKVGKKVEPLRYWYLEQNPGI